MHREERQLLARRHAWIGAMCALLATGDLAQPATSAHCRFLLSGQTATLRSGPGARGRHRSRRALRGTETFGVARSISRGEHPNRRRRFDQSGIVVKSPPDAYTVLIVCEQPLDYPSFYQRLPFDPLKDLTPDHLKRGRTISRRGESQVEKRCFELRIGSLKITVSSDEKRRLIGKRGTIRSLREKVWLYTPL